MALKKVEEKNTMLKTNKKKTEATFEFTKFQEEIKLQAYYNYLQRVKSNKAGNEVSDWLDAEKNVRMRMNA